MDITFYAAPNGNDQNPGTLEAPFATWRRAQQAVREAKPDAAGPISVYFRAGVYEIPDTIVITEADSGSGQCPVVYRALPV